ncbi:group II intron reverse transcriptase/maturase [Schlesneria sp. T3-172]|uniref:group II intron reverse transcriptase/maturase n=1 Tax=Schlesneria sphaerica TaxID=3373610 RepID=UPI0037CA1680
MSNANGESDSTSTESQTTRMDGNFPYGSREIPGTSISSETDRSEKARCHNADMHVPGKSDSFVVPKKQVHNAGQPTAAEPVEERRLTEENASQPLLVRTQSREARPRGLLGVREMAGKDKKVRFNNLLNHVTPELLQASLFDLKKQAAPGIDGETWVEYAENFQARIVDLHARIHRGTYRAKPSKRAWIPKLDGKLRPLEIAALEDKIVQQAVRVVLECIYEEDFLGFSYGFRPGRGCHRALDALSVGIEHQKVNWILDADIRGYFDNISHEWLLKFLEHRIADRRLLRLLKKWLRAGVSEDGEWSPNTVGTPQGAVISPLFSNVFLHYVLDLWVVAWRKRHAKGEVIIVRYADDFDLGFREEIDAKRCLAALTDRFTKFGLELHPEKTRLIEFGRYAAERRSKRGEGPPENFDFLGFTHVCGTTRKGGFTIRRISAMKKVRAKLQDLKDKLKRMMHNDLATVGSWLSRVYQGWCHYHAVPGNWKRLNQFRTALQDLWYRVLRRRSQRACRLTWVKSTRLSRRWLTKPKIMHPYPEVRFARLYQR